MSDERDLPDGVIDADPPGGWDETGDAEALERNAAAAGDIESAEATQGADLDLATDADGENESP
ncbi:hypothetical protein [Microbacterium immunditiarum]|uniref:Uncharacterized protein n=1 Tax=Microbacterium immunditiarum TaxID=337480 RepID=A0A7Y9GPE6_9MICO|nr:hypothetical protein [Microbacterium immunditiarum]NYE20036.1 hypothetical protein [Microbacterium immunditiarum]